MFTPTVVTRSIGLVSLLIPILALPAIAQAPVNETPLDTRDPGFNNQDESAPGIVPNRVVPDTGDESVIDESPSPSVSDGYTLGAGDRVKLDLFQVPEYSGEYQVLTDGTLSLPRIGTVSVHGLTLEEAEAEISRRYAPYLRRPMATLSLLQAGAINIAIAGEIHRPGSYTVAPEELAGTPTLTKVIQLAGGITQSANIRDIQVRRAIPQRDQSDEVLQVDLWQLLRTADLSQDVVLRDGDSIYIPTAVSMRPGEATELASASFSPDTITVNVVGEVGQPGAIAVPPNTPLNQALLAAGGFNPRASRDSVELIRLNPDGTVARQSVDIDLAQGVNADTNPALRNNDTIVVERSGLASFSDTLGTVLSPITGVFNLLRIFR